MNLDSYTDRRAKRHHDIDVASTLAAMAGNSNDNANTSSSSSTRQPPSPAWSHSSLVSDGASELLRNYSQGFTADQSTGTNDSVKSENFVFTDGASSWPSPLPSCSTSSPFSGSFTSEYGDRSLPRLPELDHISLEALASHYANAVAERGQAPPPPPFSFGLISLPREHRPITPLAPMALPDDHSVFKPKRKSPTRGSRCNIKYTIEQKDFIDYWRIDRYDRETPWDDVTREFNLQFKGPQRRNGGLQSAYYRENKKIPLADAEGLLLFDETDEVKTIEVPVREAKGRLHSVKAIGLLSSHPERAIEYPWVTREHKRKIWKIGQARQAQLESAATRQRRRGEVEARLAKSQDMTMDDEYHRPSMDFYDTSLLQSRARC